MKSCCSWTKAVTLHGVAQSFLDRTGLPWEQPETRYRQDSLERARAHLGQEQFDRDYAQGIALSPDEALNLASERSLPGL